MNVVGVWVAVAVVEFHPDHPALAPGDRVFVAPRPLYFN